jgi:hypothetical protein
MLFPRLPHIDLFHIPSDVNSLQGIAGYKCCRILYECIPVLLNVKH